MARYIVVDLATRDTVAAYLDEDNEPQCLIVPSVLDMSGPAPKLGKHVDTGDKILKRPKRVLGMSYTQAARLNLLQDLQFKDVTNRDDVIKVSVEGTDVSIEESMAFLLKCVVDEVGNKCSIYKQCDTVVLTHPANSPLPCISALKRVGVYAGLEVESVMSEAVAAAFFGLNKLTATLSAFTNKLVLNIDAGSGTTDITVLKCESSYNGTNEISVLTTYGDLHLGGNDIDKELAEFLTQKGKAMPGFAEWLKEPARLAELLVQAEASKRTLSTAETVDVKLGAFTLTVTRQELEDHCPTLVRLRKVVDDVFERELEGRDNIQPSDITNVTIAGGMSNMPIFRKIILDKMPQFREAARAYDVISDEPVKAVALGALLKLKADDDLTEDTTIKDSIASDYGIQLKRRNGLGSFIMRAVVSGRELPVIDAVLRAKVTSGRLGGITVKLWEGRDLKNQDGVGHPNNYPMGEVKIPNEDNKYKKDDPVIIKLTILDDRGVSVLVIMPDGREFPGTFHEWGKPSDEAIQASLKLVADLHTNAKMAATVLDEDSLMEQTQRVEPAENSNETHSQDPAPDHTKKSTGGQKRKRPDPVLR